MKKNNFYKNRVNKPFFRSNDKIRASEVRIVGKSVQSRVCSLYEAMRLANEAGMDLVEISPNVNPPVCKIIKLDKFLYEQKKKQKDQEKRQRELRIEVKEIRFTPNTDTHDFEFKKRHAENFLKGGDKVKALVIFKGRSIAFKEQGEILLLRFAQELESVGKVESMPKMEGRRMILIVTPKQGKKTN